MEAHLMVSFVQPILPPRKFKYVVAIDDDLVTVADHDEAINLPVLPGRHRISIQAVKPWIARRFEKGRPKVSKFARALGAGGRKDFEVVDGQTKYVWFERRWATYWRIRIEDEPAANLPATSIAVASHQDTPSGEVATEESRSMKSSVGHGLLGSSPDAQIELLGESRVTERTPEIVSVDPGATVSLTREDVVEETVVIDAATTEVNAGISVGIVEVALRHSLRTRPGHQYRMTRHRTINITLDGRGATEWRIGFEDEWQRARLVTRNQSSPIEFEYLVRTKTFATAVTDS